MFEFCETIHSLSLINVYVFDNFYKKIYKTAIYSSRSDLNTYVIQSVTQGLNILVRIYVDYLL